MANEISITWMFSLVKSGLRISLPNKIAKHTFIGEYRYSATKNVSTTYEALEKGELASAEWGLFTNLDATNYVEIGLEVSSAFYPLIKLQPGQDSLPIPLSTASLFARANGAPVRLEYTLLGDD